MKIDNNSIKSMIDIVGLKQDESNKKITNLHKFSKMLVLLTCILNLGMNYFL